MTPIVEPIGQRTQDCPMCDGIMPETAIKATPWRVVIAHGVTCDSRVVSMLCPHCGHRDSKVQRRPVGGSFYPLTADR